MGRLALLWGRKMFTRNRIIPLIFSLCLLHASAVLAQTDGSTARIAPALQDILAQYTPSDEDIKAGAVALKKIYQLTSDGTGLVGSTEYVAIKLFNKSAADDYSQIEERFNHFYTELHLDFARLIAADGTVHDIKPDAWKIEDVPETYIFSDLKQLIFSLPAVAQGSVIEYQLSFKTKTRKMGQYWMRSPMFHHIHYSSAKHETQFVRTHESIIRLDAPQREYIKYKLLNADVATETVKTGDRVNHNWRLKDLPVIETEDGMPTLDHIVPLLHITSAQDWRSVDQWAAAMFLPAAKPDGSLRKLAQRIAKGATSRQDKIRAVYKYMQENIRYIGTYLERGGYLPNKASVVVKNRYGDCKDQTILIIALLDALGIQAQPALLRTFPELRVERDIPTNQFSHMIVYVPDEQLWIDTSGDEAEFPSIDWKLETRTAFIVDGQGGYLKEVPRSAPQQNQIKLSGDYHYQGNDIHYQVHMVLTGIIGNRWRAALNASTEPDKLVAKALAEIYTADDITNIQISDYKDIDTPLRLSARMVYKNRYTAKQPEVRFTNNAFAVIPMFYTLNKLIAVQQRRYSYSNSMSFQFIQENTYHAPAPEYKPILRDTSRDHRSNWIVTQNHHDSSGNTLTTRSTITYNNTTVPREEFTALQDSYKTATSSSQWSLSFLYDKHYARQLEIEEQLKGKTNNTKALLDLAEHHLNLGEYEKAMDLSNKVIAKDTQNGRAYYLLGITLGFMDRYDESDAALSKADTLGYAP